MSTVYWCETCNLPVTATTSLISFLSELFPDPEGKARGFLEYTGVCQETLKCSTRYPCCWYRENIKHRYLCALSLCTVYFFFKIL